MLNSTLGHFNNEFDFIFKKQLNVKNFRINA